jgi:hypothetical protein
VIRIVAALPLARSIANGILSIGGAGVGEVLTLFKGMYRAMFKRHK